MNMSSKTTLLFFLLLFYTASLSAKYYPDRGAYGSLDFMYNDNRDKSGNHETNQVDYTHMYRLGYMGNIYSPRLLDYTIEGSLKYETVNSISGGYENTTKTDTKGYKVNLRFIKNTRLPFSVFFIKQSMPVTFIANTTGRYVYNTKARGFSGAINLNALAFNYGLSTTDSETDASGIKVIRTFDSYNAGMRYTKKAHSAEIKYTNTQQTDSDKNKTSNIGANQIDEKVKMSYIWKYSDMFDFSTSAGHDKQKLDSLSTTTDASMQLNWNYEQKYVATIQATGYRLKYNSYEYNSSEISQTNQLDMFSVTQNFRYKILPELNFSQTAMMTKFDSQDASGSNQIVMVNLNHTYSKNILEDIMFNLSTSAGAQKLQNETFNYMNDTHSELKSDNIQVSINANANKQMPEIHSITSISSSYSNMKTSNDEERAMYNLALTVSSNYMSVLRNAISLNYMKTDSTTLNGSADELSKLSLSSTSISDKIAANFRLGVRGSFNVGVGIIYSRYYNANESMKRVNPNISMGLTYRLMKDLMFASNAMANKDIFNEYYTYSASSNLSYFVGKTSMSIQYLYAKSESTNDEDPLARDRMAKQRSSLLAKLTRRF